MRAIITLAIVLLLSGCNKQHKQENLIQTSKPLLELSYAKGFSVTDYKGFKLLEVSKPFQGASQGLRYLLVPKKREIPQIDEDVTIIRTPVDRIACTSTTHIPLLDYLGETTRLVAFPNTDYISSEKMRTHIDAGKVTDLGSDATLNLEKLAISKPEVVMGYSVTGDFGEYKKIEGLGMHVVINAEYLEDHPLGRAEWIKFAGLLFEKEEIAAQVFSMIKNNYEATLALIPQSAKKPTVFSGIMYGDAWFLPGGKNNMATLFRDAGYKYLWESDSSTGFLKVSFEHVYERAQHADYWIGVASFSTLEELKRADHRYEKFKAFKTKQVYTYDARKGKTGGSEYLELGYLRPDIVLKDLIKITQPELLPDHVLYFHQSVK